MPVIERHSPLAMDQRPVPKAGACFVWEDPELDSRDGDPIWLRDPDTLISLSASPDDADLFSVWAIPGRKSLIHDGRRVLLRSILARGTLRLSLDPTLSDGHPFAYRIPAGRRYVAKSKAAEFSNAVIHHRVPTPAITRRDLVHMRALHAIDLADEGASEREIARAMFPRGDTSDWNDGALRAQVRYLLRHGRAFRDGRYRELLRADSAERSISTDPSEV